MDDNLNTLWPVESSKGNWESISCEYVRQRMRTAHRFFGLALFVRDPGRLGVNNTVEQKEAVE